LTSAGPYANLHLTPDNHASTPPLTFLQTGCPFCCPTNSVKALKANNIKLSICRKKTITNDKHNSAFIVKMEEIIENRHEIQIQKPESNSRVDSSIEIAFNQQPRADKPSGFGSLCLLYLIVILQTCIPQSFVSCSIIWQISQLLVGLHLIL